MRKWVGTHLGRSGFADFDVPLEHRWVHEAEIERRNSHGYWYGDEVEDGLVSEKAEVVERVAYMPKRVDYHPALGPRSAAWVVEQLKDVSGWGTTVGGVLGGTPDLARPEEAALVGVFAKVADDVGLLKEQTD
jgi:hypothetical protein